MMISKASEKRMLEAAGAALRKERLTEVVRVAAGLPKPPAEVITYGAVTVTLPDGRQFERVEGGWIDEFVRSREALGEEIVLKVVSGVGTTPPVSIGCTYEELDIGVDLAGPAPDHTAIVVQQVEARPVDVQCDVRYSHGPAPYDEGWELAFVAWIHYFVEAEEHDRGLPGAWTQRMGEQTWHVRTDHRDSSQAFAAKARKRVVDILAYLNVDAEKSRSAARHVCEIGHDYASEKWRRMQRVRTKPYEKVMGVNAMFDAAAGERTYHTMQWLEHADRAAISHLATMPIPHFDPRDFTIDDRGQVQAVDVDKASLTRRLLGR